MGRLHCFDFVHTWFRFVWSDLVKDLETFWKDLVKNKENVKKSLYCIIKFTDLANVAYNISVKCNLNYTK